MNPVDPFHHSGELLFQLIMAAAEIMLDLTGYSGSPEGVVGMMIMVAVVCMAVS